MVCHSEEQVLNAASVGRIAKGLLLRMVAR